MSKSLAPFLSSFVIALMTWFCACASGVHWGSDACGFFAGIGCFLSIMTFLAVYAGTKGFL